MRLPLISPADLTPEQRPLYEDMRGGIETNFKGFKAIAVSGELVGPWNPWLHFPKFGGPVWELVKALSTSPSLPKPVREVAILVTGARFRSAYEIYAHVLVAEARGLPDDKIGWPATERSQPGRGGRLRCRRGVGLRRATAGTDLPSGRGTLHRERHGRADQPDRPVLRRLRHPEWV